MDIENFFPTITIDEVNNLFCKRGFARNVSKLLSELTTYQGVLVQGAPTSTTLANLIFNSIDKDLIEFSKANNLTCTRWIDDMSFSSRNDLKCLEAFYREGYTPSIDIGQIPNCKR